MSRSVLLQLARDSIEEVIEAKKTLNKTQLTQEHPLLLEKIKVTLKLFKDGELRGSNTQESATLVDAIIIAAKKAAFEDDAHPPITTSEYLHSEIELTLFSSDGMMSEKDKPILD